MTSVRNSCCIFSTTFDRRVSGCAGLQPQYSCKAPTSRPHIRGRSVRLQRMAVTKESRDRQASGAGQASVGITTAVYVQKRFYVLSHVTPRQLCRLSPCSLRPTMVGRSGHFTVAIPLCTRNWSRPLCIFVKTWRANSPFSPPFYSRNPRPW